MQLRNHKGLLLFVLFIFSSFANGGIAKAKNLRLFQDQKIDKLKKKIKIVFLITEDQDNYEADKTVLN